MKNISKLLLAGVMSASLVACSQPKQEEPVEEEKVEEVAEAATGKYTLYNKTGETVTEVYLYLVDSEDKGENLAGEGMEADASFEATFEAAADATLVLEFTTESGYNAKFETLHIEEAPISLLSQDTMTGATPIAFSAE